MSHDGRGGRGALRGCGMRQFRGQSMQAEGVREGHGGIGGGRVCDGGVVSLIIGEVRGGAGAKEAMRHASDSRTFHRLPGWQSDQLDLRKWSPK